VTGQTTPRVEFLDARDGSLTPADLIGKLDVLRVECEVRTRGPLPR
jgi:hypothetical protein